jgi:hypothetical protein
MNPCASEAVSGMSVLCKGKITMATDCKKHEIKIGQTVMVRPACIRKATVIATWSHPACGGCIRVEYEDKGIFAGYTLPQTGTLYDHEVEPIECKATCCVKEEAPKESK